MQSLSELIATYNKPDILLDSFNPSSKKYAAWGFDEIFEINHKGCFLNNEKIDGDYFQILQNIISKWKQDTPSNQLACIGFISYEFKKFIYEHIQFSKKSKNNFPYLWFCKPKLVQEFSDTSIIEYSEGQLEIIQDIMDYSQYSEKIDAIKSSLECGDVYQINFTDFKKIKSSFKSSFDLYLSLREISKPNEGFFLKTDHFDILSLSPELFIKVENQKICTAPIKGTRPSMGNLNQDKAVQNELQKSIKDRAEHLMIVDLLRNDLGKICEIGSIEVTNLYDIKSFETIHHMVSNIQGLLKNNITEVDIIKALFPGGSITGAPKESAMFLIDQLETSARNIYTGIAGYIRGSGDMSFNICIRTLLRTNDVYEYGVGGGIVWDSIAKHEWKEAHQKSKILESLL